MPKKPQSAYLLFSQEERLKVRNENPNFSNNECAKELGRRWKVVSPEEKLRFQQLADLAKQKYDLDMAAHRQIYHLRFFVQIGLETAFVMHLVEIIILSLYHFINK